MLDAEKMADIVRDFKGPSPHGISCKFIKLDDQWGIKVYFNIVECERAHERQKRMSQFGFAPQVGIMFAAGMKMCYITEVAEPVVEGGNHNYTQWMKLEKLAREKNPSIDEDINKLTEDMSDKDYHMTDCHYGNFGYINGKLVAIDFGN